MTLPERMEMLVKQHGGLNAAARAVRIDHAYFHRLLSGEKKEPSAAVLRKLGLRRVVTYALTLPAAQQFYEQPKHRGYVGCLGYGKPR